MLRLLIAAGALSLAACSAQPDDPAAVSADEARQMNEAAAMLDANSVDPNAIDPAAPAANDDTALNESQPR